MSQSVGASARIVEHLCAGLAESLSSMTARAFTVVAAGDQSAGPGQDQTFVWQQGFSAIGEPGLWVAAGSDLWVEAGKMVLAAVGIDSATDADCRSTWAEISGQAMGSVATRVTADLQHEVTAIRGEEVPAMPDISPVTLSVACEGRTWTLAVACAPAMNGLYEPKAPAPLSTEGSFSRTFDLLLDVALPVSVSFGKTALPIREVLKLNTGSIVELNRLVSEPVEVIVNDCVIAQGEVVVVEGNYGVRITHLASREDRMRSGMDFTVKAAGAGAGAGR